MKARIFLTALPLALLAAAPSAAATEPDLAAIRAASEKYRDLRVATAEGYLPAPECLTAEHVGQPAARGAMGVHYFRPDLLGITAPPNPRVDGNGMHMDFLRPAVLIYEPQADGSMQLVAVENLVFEAAWRAAGHDRPPVFRGRNWDHMADNPATPADEAHGFTPHFDQHLWLFRDNPAGVDVPFNPSVTCAHYRPAGGAGAHSGH
ncbi:MAG TPA: hypothetical protein VIT38_14460 [Allosphingosinicella sp.]